MRSFAIPALLLLPLLAPLAAAEGAPDGALVEIRAVENLVAGKRAVSVWGEMAWTQFPGRVDIALQMDGVEIGRAVWWNVGPYLAVDGNVPEGAPEGNHTFALVLDPDGLIAESDESNNALSFVGFVHAGPYYDIVALGLSLPEYTFAGEPFFAGGHMRIAGAPETGGWSSADGTTFETRLWIDGEYVCCRMTGNLGRGEWDFVHWWLELDAGYHAYEMVVDWDNSSYETDESNNVARGWIRVLDAPADATVRILDIEHPTLRTDLGPIAGHPAKRVAHVEACNEGAMAIPRGGITVTLAGADGALLGGGDARTLLADERALDWLAPGKCVEYEIEYALEAVGDYVLTATVTGSAQLDTSNDIATREDFLVLGGAGGYTL